MRLSTVLCCLGYSSVNSRIVPTLDIRKFIKTDNVSPSVDDIIWSPSQISHLRSQGLNVSQLHMDESGNGRAALSDTFITPWDVVSDDNTAFVIPYRFNANYPEADKQSIRDSVNALSSALNNCVQFVDDTDTQKYGSAYADVTCNQDGGCVSALGMVGPGQKLQLMTPSCSSTGNTCISTGTIQHEFIHTLGFAHEQVRPDRDNFITVNTDNIKPGAITNYDIISNSQWEDMTSPYDIGSVMHYGSKSFITDAANAFGQYTMTTLAGEYIEGRIFIK
jgi:hypothetical protein